MLPPGLVAAPSVVAAHDRRDVPSGDTALHLAVRLQLSSLVSALTPHQLSSLISVLTAAGGGPPLQNHTEGYPTPGDAVLGVQVHCRLLLSRVEEGRASVASSNSPRAIDPRWRCFFTLIAAFLFPMLQSLFGDVAISVCKCCMNALDHVAIVF
jgi:hypothetical protein